MKERDWIEQKIIDNWHKPDFRNGVLSENAELNKLYGWKTDEFLVELERKRMMKESNCRQINEDYLTLLRMQSLCSEFYVPTDQTKRIFQEIRSRNFAEEIISIS